MISVTTQEEKSKNAHHEPDGQGEGLCTKASDATPYNGSSCSQGGWF